MLKAALCGSYVNFGVFRLYGDEALDNALNTFVKLLLSIPQTDLLVSKIGVFQETREIPDYFKSPPIIFMNSAQSIPLNQF